MITSADENLVKWGLHELDGGRQIAYDAGSSGHSSVTESSRHSSEHEAIPYAESLPHPYINLVPLPHLPSTTADDAAIAQALQEEFSKLDAGEEEAGSTASVHKQSQVPFLTQNWVDIATTADSTLRGGGPEFKQGLPEHVQQGGDHVDTLDEGDYGQVTTYDWDSTDEEMNQQTAGSNPSSSLHENRPYDLDDDDRQIVLTLSEFPQVDKEVARRLTKLESIKHVPKINGSIPTYDDASADHRRLLDRLDLYGLIEQKIKGDGNCQFRALSDQLYRTPEHHKFVRKSVVAQLKTTPDVYSNYVPMKYTDYVKNMGKNGEWGDHVTLQAAADYYGVKVSLITSFKDTCFIEITPAEQKSEREMYLSFWAEVHYNSIYPASEDFLHRQAHHHGKKRHWLGRFF